MFYMQILPINLDYKNILLSESTKMVRKSKKKTKQPDGIKGTKEPKFDSYLMTLKTKSGDCPRGCKQLELTETLPFTNLQLM